MTTHNINKEEVIKLKNLIEQFRLHDSEMQLQTVVALLNTHLRQDHPDGYSVKDMAKDLGLSQASASRNWMVWSKLTRQRTPGPDFIQAIECPNNRSRKRLSLTYKGIKFLEHLFPQ